MKKRFQILILFNLFFSQIAFGVNEFTLFDFITGKFNIFLRDTITNYEWEIPSVEIIDGINNISITMGYSLNIENIEGDFALNFMIIDSIGNPTDNVEIRMEYEGVNGAGD